MKRLVILLSLALASLTSGAADVGVSIRIGEPGFYGRIDIGDIPHPELIYRQPLIIKPVVGVVHAPVYMHVPPGHAKDWSKHCRKYNACSERVFFVHDHWYNDVYVPQYKKQHGKSGHKENSNHGQGQGKGKGNKNGD